MYKISKKFGGSVIASVSNLGAKTVVEEVLGAVKVMLDSFDQGKTF